MYETILAGTSGTLTRDVSLQVDHAFLLWLVGTFKAGYGTDDYVGSTLSDQRYFLSGGLTYKMNRDLQLKGEVREDWQTATQPPPHLHGDIVSVRSAIAALSVVRFTDHREAPAQRHHRENR